MYAVSVGIPPVYSGYEASELSEWDLEYLENQGAKKIWYYYGTEPYAGAGNAIIQNTEGKYFLENLGHCSCNGPTEGITLTGGFNHLEELLAACSGEYTLEIQVLIDTVLEEQKNS